MLFQPVYLIWLVLLALGCHSKLICEPFTTKSEQLAFILKSMKECCVNQSETNQTHSDCGGTNFMGFLQGLTLLEKTPSTTFSSKKEVQVLTQFLTFLSPHAEAWIPSLFWTVLLPSSESFPNHLPFLPFVGSHQDYTFLTTFCSFKPAFLQPGFFPSNFLTSNPTFISKLPSLFPQLTYLKFFELHRTSNMGPWSVDFPTTILSQLNWYQLLQVFKPFRNYFNVSNGSKVNTDTSNVNSSSPIHMCQVLLPPLKRTIRRILDGIAVPKCTFYFNGLKYNTKVNLNSSPFNKPQLDPLEHHIFQVLDRLPESIKHRTGFYKT